MNAKWFDGGAMWSVCYGGGILVKVIAVVEEEKKFLREALFKTYQNLVFSQVMG